SHQASAFFGLVLVDVWEWTPLLFLICLAGLQSIPQEPLEAAAVDGAGPVRLFFNHTLPLLLPVLAVGVVLRLIDAVGTFDQIFVLTRGGPGTATQLISIYGYNTAFNFTDYGHGAAMLIALLAFAFLLVLVALSLMRRAAKRVAQGSGGGGTGGGGRSAWGFLGPRFRSCGCWRCRCMARGGSSAGRPS